MKHINDSYVNAVMKVFYNQYMETCTDDCGISYEDYKKVFDMNFINRCVTLANDIIKHPGKYDKHTAKLIKKSSFMKKKYWAMIVAAILIKGDGAE